MTTPDVPYCDNETVDHGLIPTPLGRGGQTPFMAGYLSLKEIRAQAMITFLCLSGKKEKGGRGPIPLLLQKTVAVPPLQESLPFLQRRRAEAMTTPTLLY